MSMHEKLTAEINLAGTTYSAQAREQALLHVPELVDVYELWVNALQDAHSLLGLPGSFTDTKDLQNATLARFPKLSGSKFVMGLNGPGATGKDTVSGKLGWPKVINTTTRPARPYETDGKEYHFRTEEEFHKMVEQGVFLVHQERKGRGFYGIRREDADAVLETSRVAIIEENPATLYSLIDRVEESGATMFVTYLLPPTPPLAHLILRLANRCVTSGDDLAQTVVSTLGKRQVDEFITTFKFIEEGKPFVYIVNDVVDDAAARIEALIPTR